MSLDSSGFASRRRRRGRQLTQDRKSPKDAGQQEGSAEDDSKQYDHLLPPCVAHKRQSNAQGDQNDANDIQPKPIISLKQSQTRSNTDKSPHGLTLPPSCWHG